MMSKEKETMGAKLITATFLAVIAAMMLAVPAQAAGPLDRILQRGVLEHRVGCPPGRDDVDHDGQPR